MADDIRKETEKLSQEIDDASKELKAGFQKIIGGLKETNAPLAKSVANLRKQSKNTFAGALGSAKLKDVSSQIDKFLSEGLDEKAFDKLQAEFGDIDLTQFKRISESAKSLEDGIKSLEDARDERIANSKVLQKKDAEIEKREMDALSLTGAALDAHMKKTEELKKSREDSYNRIAGGYEKQIESQKKLLKEERGIRDDFNEKLNKELSGMTSFEGLTEFSDSLKNLTGIDVEGGLNKAVETVLSIVAVVKGIPVFFQKAVEVFGKVMTGLSTAFTKVGTLLSTVGKAFTGAIKAVGSAMASVAKRLVAGLATFATSAVAFIGGLLATAGGMLVAALPFIGIGLLIAAGVAAIVAGGMYLYDKFQENKELIYEKMGDFATRVGEVVQNIKDFFVGSFIKAKAGVSDFGDRLSDMFASFSDFVQGVILSVKEGLNKIGIGDADEIAAERAQLEKNKKQRELASQERARQAEERSNLSAVELARIERQQEEEEIKRLQEEDTNRQIRETQERIKEIDAKLADDYYDGDRWQLQTERKFAEMDLQRLQGETGDISSVETTGMGKPTLEPVEEKSVPAMQRALTPTEKTQNLIDILDNRNDRLKDSESRRMSRLAELEDKYQSLSEDDRKSGKGIQLKSQIDFERRGLDNVQSLIEKNDNKISDLISSAQEEPSASQIKRSREETEEMKGSGTNNVVSQVSANTNNVSNVSNRFFSGRAVTGDSDSTMGKLNSLVS